MKYLIALFVIVLFSAAVPVVAGTFTSQDIDSDGLNAVNAFLPSNNEQEVSFTLQRNNQR